MRAVPATLLVNVVQLIPSSDRCTRYAVIVAPPVDDGAVQLSVTCRNPAVATGLRGAVGTVRGLEVTDDEYAPVPAALMAATRNRYDVPLVSPVFV